MMVRTATPTTTATMRPAAAITATARAPLYTTRRAHGHAHAHGHGIEADVVGAQLRQCKVATLTGAVANVFFSITKVWLGSTGGSVALLADGVHALTDLVADAISYTTLTLSRKKLPRCHYPFGIGRLETAGTVLVSAILFAGGVALLVQSLRRCVHDALAVATTTMTKATADEAATTSTAAVQQQHDDHHDNHDHDDASHGHSHFTLTRYNADSGQQVVLWSMVLLAASSVVCKEVLFRWTRRVGLRAGSRVVVANAYHHRADAWSGAVALVGVAAQCASIPGVDGIAGLVVSLSICKIGLELFRESVFEFFDYQDAVEVARVRAQLQLFHVHVDGPRVAHDMTGNATCVTTTPPATPTTTQTLTPTTPATMTAPRQPVRFINVFLTRHGHSYALHVTLLVRATLTAAQIEAACDELTTLARSSVDVADTLITLLVCRDAVVTRDNYTAAQEQHAHAAHDHHHHHHHTRDATAEHVCVVAAMGDTVNPSLERCLAALTAMHHFRTPIRYDWPQRVLIAADAGSDDCMKDVESIAHAFGCRVNVLRSDNNDNDDDDADVTSTRERRH